MAANKIGDRPRLIPLAKANDLREVSKLANIQGMNWTVSYFNERVQREITE